MSEKAREGMCLGEATLAIAAGAQCITHLASYPGLLTPAFVACSTNAGEGLVKLVKCARTYLDVWRSGTFILYSCKVAFWIQATSPRLSDVERSVVLWSVFAIGSTLAYLLLFLECATPPHVQVCHCTWFSFTRPSPVLVLQATNAGVRRPGYETLTHHPWVVVTLVLQTQHI